MYKVNANKTKYNIVSNVFKFVDVSHEMSIFGLTFLILDWKYTGIY